MTYTAYPSVTITHNGVDVTTKVISYSRGKDLCNFTGECVVVFDIDCGISFSIWDRILIRDVSATGTDGYYFVNTISKDQKQITISCQDGSKLLQDYFIDTPYTSYLGQTTKTLLEYFLDLAGVTYSFDASVGLGELVQPYTSYGMTSAMTTVASLLQQSSWYAYFDGNNVMQIFELTQDETNSAGTINGNEILAMKIVTSDKMFRNRVVVWGGGDPDTGDYVYADVNITSEHQIDAKDIRTVVVQNGNIDSSADAVEIATDVLNVLGKINDEVNIECTFRSEDTDLRGVDLAKVFTINSTKLQYTGIITEIEVEYGIGGLIIKLNLGRKCPKIFGYYNYPGTPVNTSRYWRGLISNQADLLSDCGYDWDVPTENRYYEFDDTAVCNALASGVVIDGVAPNPTVTPIDMFTTPYMRRYNVVPDPCLYDNYVYYVELWEDASLDYIYRYDLYRKDLTTGEKKTIFLGEMDNPYYIYNQSNHESPNSVEFFTNDAGEVYLWCDRYDEGTSEYQVSVLKLNFDEGTYALMARMEDIRFGFLNNDFSTLIVPNANNTVTFYSGYSSRTTHAMYSFDYSFATESFGDITTIFSLPVRLRNLPDYYSCVIVGDKLIMQGLEKVGTTYTNCHIYIHDLVTKQTISNSFGLPEAPTNSYQAYAQILPCVSDDAVYVRASVYNGTGHPPKVADRIYKVSLTTAQNLEYRDVSATHLFYFYDSSKVYELLTSGEVYELFADSTAIFSMAGDPLFEPSRWKVSYCARMDDNQNIYFCKPASWTSYGKIYRTNPTTRAIELVKDLAIEITPPGTLDSYCIASEQLYFLPDNRLVYTNYGAYHYDFDTEDGVDYVESYILENS